MLGIFSRQSTVKQSSIPLQRELGEKFAKENNLSFRHYVEKGISGGAKIENRKEFTRLLDDIQDGKINKVFIWVQDRAEREPLTWHTLCNAILEAEAELYENGELIELENDMVYMMRGITSLMNRSERRKNNKRIIEKLVNNAEKGKRFSMMPYGYTVDKDNLMIVDPLESEVIETIFNLSMDGLGYSAIANYLNDEGIPTRYNKIAKRTDEGSSSNIKSTYAVDINRNNNLPENIVIKSKENTKWVSGTVKNMIHNRTYIGKRIFRQKEYDCPAIIDESIFQKVHDNIANRKKKSGKRSKNNFLLNDLLFCIHCGKRFTGRTVSGHWYYRCASQIKTGGSCGNRSIRTDLIEAFVWGRFFIDQELIELVQKNLSETDTTKKIATGKKQIQKTESELLTIESRRKKIVNLVIEGIITNEDAKGQLKSVEEKKELLEKDIRNLNEELDNLNAAAKKKTEINNDIKKIRKDTSYIKKKEIIQKYIKRVSILALPINRTIVEYIFTVHFNLTMEPEQYMTKEGKFYPFTSEAKIV